MTTVAIFSQEPHADSMVHRAYSSILWVCSSVRQWNRARLTRIALLKLSDHELDDIGFVRGDIDDLAYSSMRRR